MSNRLVKLFCSKSREITNLSKNGSGADAAAIRVIEDLAGHCDAAETREGRKALHEALLSILITSTTTTEGFPYTVMILADAIRGLAEMGVIAQGDE